MKRLLAAFDDKNLRDINNLLLSGHADPNMIIHGKGVSPFHLIIGNQSENFAFHAVKLMLRHGADPNVRSLEGVTPTHVAAAWGRTRILHLLLVNGADPWLQDDDLKNAFNYAFEEQEWDTVEMLHHFQLVHTCGNWNREVYSAQQRVNVNLKRVLVQTGEEVFEYVPEESLCLSKETQTGVEEMSECSSPVQDMVKFFETTLPPSPEFGWKEREKPELGWSKDFYQKPSEVTVHWSDPQVPAEKSFVSSVHIDLTDSVSKSEPLVTEGAGPKIKSPSRDVRTQLFSELKKAVMSRSRLTGSPSHNEKAELSRSSVNSTWGGGEAISGVAPLPDVSGLTCLKLEASPMLRSMSEFATRVRNEIEERPSSCEEQDSSPVLNSAYLTCEEDGPLDCRVSTESFASVTEEYRYTDVEEDVVLVEKKLLVNPAISLDKGEAEELGDASACSSLPSASYDSDALRSRLMLLGYRPGPITDTTKRLYLRKLYRMERNGTTAVKCKVATVANVYPSELEKTLRDEAVLSRLLELSPLEEEMSAAFDRGGGKRRWRGGSAKTSFNYLLLDSRATLDLPKRAASLPRLAVWRCFLASVFYIGKGKRSRPYSHLYEAYASWQGKGAAKGGRKVQRILDIWQEGLGVVCLHVFQNIIPSEAFTREAAMLEGIGLANVTNQKSGEYYGAVTTWRTKEKLKLGVYLLYKAMLVFLSEGERHLRPLDIAN